MKKPIIALLLAAVLLFGLSAALSGTARDNARKSHLELLKTLLPGAEEFTLESATQEGIRSVHKSDAGYVVEASANGYAGEITMLIGVNNAGRVTGLVVTDAHETFGLGGKILTDHEFLSQFLNRTGSFRVSASAEEEVIGVDAITGATVTSKAVVRCVNAAIAYVTGADAVTEATSWGG